MASELPDSSPFIENLLNNRNRDNSLLIPFIFGLNASRDDRSTQPDRIVLVNPLTQGMVVIDRSDSELTLETLLNGLESSKTGRPPATKASIDALESVEVACSDGDQCVICLEEWEAGEKAKRMPCRHLFHGECIEKWLNVHASCPVCRHEMPVDDCDDEKKGRSGGERRREIWVSFTVGSERSGQSESDDAGEDSQENVSL